MMEHKELRHGVHAARVLLSEGATDTMVRLIKTGREPAAIRENEVLGTLVPVDLLSESTPTTRQETTALDETAHSLLSRVDESLADDARNQLESLILEFHDVFSLRKSDLGRCEMTRHRIDTGSSRPVRQPLRSQPRAYREVIDREVEQMLEWISSSQLRANGQPTLCSPRRKTAP